MEIPTPETARLLAIQAHGDQKYGDKPYVDHLDDVVDILRQTGWSDPDILMVGYLHDAIEDTTLTLQELRQFGYPDVVVEGIQFVTDEPGPNRKTRKLATYARVARADAESEGTTLGIVVKWADRIANCRRSKGTSLLGMYQKEDETFRTTYMPKNVDLLRDSRFQAQYNLYLQALQAS